MMGVISGHKLTPTDDKRFSETVYSLVCEECQISKHKMQDEEHYNAEQRTYHKGRYEAYCDILSDMNIREDIRIRGMADAYNEIVSILNNFAMGCKKKEYE